MRYSCCHFYDTNLIENTKSVVQNPTNGLPLFKCKDNDRTKSMKGLFLFYQGWDSYIALVDPIFNS